MAWGKLELEAEVEEWLLGLSEDEQGRVQFYFDLLEETKAYTWESPIHASCEGSSESSAFTSVGRDGESRTSSQRAGGSRCLRFSGRRKGASKERSTEP